MSERKSITQDSRQACLLQPLAMCKDCQTQGKLMCRFDIWDSVHFFMIMLPYGVTAIAGTIRGGYGWYLLFWLAYSLFFFFVWEARILCSHCPYWSESGKMLRCHANYGVLKIWKYHPEPMSKFEKAQFLIGGLLFIAFPFPFLLLSHEYLLTLIGISMVISGVYLLKGNICNRCINFSCPLNNVPKQLVDTYLDRNPVMQTAWKNIGYIQNNL